MLLKVGRSLLTACVFTYGIDALGRYHSMKVLAVHIICNNGVRHCMKL